MNYVSAAEIAPLMPWPSTACVVDARGIDPPPKDSPLFAWLQTASAPRVILLDRATGQQWIEVSESFDTRVITLAPHNAAFTADISMDLPVDANADAVTAIANGASLIELALPEVAKRRFDEARLVRRHNGDDAEDDTELPETENSDDATPPAPTDPLLVRATQILLGLQVLGSP